MRGGSTTILALILYLAAMKKYRSTGSVVPYKSNGGAFKNGAAGPSPP
jgi:hypothetical protein